MNKKTKKIVLAALMAALTCITTMVVTVPSPLSGYLNLGDCIVLCSGWLLGPVYGFAAAGLGSALADLFAGYVTYAPATFVIKGLMAVIAYFIFKLLCKKLGNIAARIISALVAEIVMVGGYYVFESFLYSNFATPVANIPANGIQGLAGLIAGVLLINIFEKINRKVIK